MPQFIDLCVRCALLGDCWLRQLNYIVQQILVVKEAYSIVDPSFQADRSGVVMKKSRLKFSKKEILELIFVILYLLN